MIYFEIRLPSIKSKFFTQGECIKLKYFGCKTIGRAPTPHLTEIVGPSTNHRTVVLFCPAANIYRVIGNCKNVKSAVMQRKKAKERKSTTASIKKVGFSLFKNLSAFIKMYAIFFVLLNKTIESIRFFIRFSLYCHYELNSNTYSQ